MVSGTYQNVKIHFFLRYYYTLEKKFDSNLFIHQFIHTNLTVAIPNHRFTILNATFRNLSSTYRKIYRTFVAKNVGKLCKYPCFFTIFALFLKKIRIQTYTHTPTAYNSLFIKKLSGVCTTLNIHHTYTQHTSVYSLFFSDLPQMVYVCMFILHFSAKNLGFCDFFIIFADK